MNAKALLNSVVKIAQESASISQSPGKKAFAALIKKIEQRRKKMAAWETAMPAFQKVCETKLFPALTACCEAREPLARRLDELGSEKKLTAKERRVAAESAAELCGWILSHGSEKDEIKEIYNRRSGSNLDMEKAFVEAVEKEALKAEVAHMFGVDIGDVSDLTMEEAIEKAERLSLEKADEMREAEMNRAERRASRKKTPKKKETEAKHAAKETRREAENAQVSASLREVYRKLASALHPDRETDAMERARKNALMAEANAAYAKKDLLKLLELQLTSEKIDQNAMASWDEAKVLRFNKILKEQVRELDEELERIEDNFCMAAGLDPDYAINPKHVVSTALRDAENFKRAEESAKRELALIGDVKGAKEWLRAMAAKY